MDTSFVVPIYNDGAHAEAFCEAFAATFQSHLGREDIADSVELIFVDDGSSDDSFAELRELAARFPFVKAIGLSRNFGQHLSVTCGYRHARGRVVGMINVDMEDAPDQIPRLLERLRRGDVDIVTGLRTTRPVSWTSRFFHWVLSRLTGYPLRMNCATLRVMNRRFVDAYNTLSEKNLFLPALEQWLGFRHGYVDIEQRAPTTKRSSYTFRSRLNMAHDAIISFSGLPLRLVVFLGFAVAFAGCLLVMVLVIGKLFFIDFRPGFTSTLSVIVLLSGIQISVIGMVGLYVARILTEVQSRPQYLIRECVNIEGWTHGS